MKTTEINQSIIGKRCECMFTGMKVKGIITEIEDCKYSVNVKVVFEKVLQNLPFQKTAKAPTFPS